MRRIVVREAGKDDGSDDNNEERGQRERGREGWLNQGRRRRSREGGFRGIYTNAAAHVYSVSPKDCNNAPLSSLYCSAHCSNDKRCRSNR